MKPILIYDGECDFCRFWVERWRGRIHDMVEFVPYQSVLSEYPEIPGSEFARAVVLIDEAERRRSGAEAVCKLWSYRSRTGTFLWWCYRRVHLFDSLAHVVYGHIASHRRFYWKLTRLLFRR